MAPWDPFTAAHMGILSVTGLLGLDVAPRHELSCTGRAGAICLGDLWSGDDDKITWKGKYLAHYTSYEEKYWNLDDEKYEEHSNADEDEYVALNISDSKLTLYWGVDKQTDGSYTVSDDDGMEYTKQ